jgi:opacity protein-like surface antigen
MATLQARSKYSEVRDRDRGRVTFDDTSTTFAFQAGAGVRYEINPSMLISLGYLFRGTAGVDFDGVQTVAVPAAALTCLPIFGAF